MPYAGTKDIRFIDKVTRESYKVIWMNDSRALLEDDDSVQILISVLRLKTYFEFFIPGHSGPLTEWARDRVKGKKT